MVHLVSCYNMIFRCLHYPNFITINTFRTIIRSKRSKIIEFVITVCFCHCCCKIFCSFILCQCPLSVFKNKPFQSNTDVFILCIILVNNTINILIVENTSFNASLRIINKSKIVSISWRTDCTIITFHNIRTFRINLR